jgi:hypothetical protein
LSAIGNDTLCSGVNEPAPAQTTRTALSTETARNNSLHWSSNATSTLGLAMSFETQVDDWTYPVMYSLIKLSLSAAVFFAFLIWLYQPRVLENPGVAAFQPPPATRLVPAPRKMDPPEIFEIASTGARVAVVDGNRSSDAIIKKSISRVGKHKPRQKAVPLYRDRERVFANDRYRGWNGSRYNFWF